MSLESRIEGLLRQANLTAKHRLKIAENIVLQAIIITPKEQIPVISVTHFAEVGDFVSQRTDRIGIKVLLQPGVYFDRIVPYRDNLTIQVIMDTDSERKVREFVCNPMIDRDLRTEGDLSSATNLAAYDHTNMVEYEFQLMDRNYARIRNKQVNVNYQMANPGKLLPLLLDKCTKEVDMSGLPPYKGIYIHLPVDNNSVYPQVLCPAGMRLVDLPIYLQNKDEYGIYSKGLGCFYKQNYWWVYPLFNYTLVDTHHRPIDLIRVPQDKIPTLDYTFYKSDVALTIISTGDAMHSDNADIRKQNKGVGKRVIQGSAIAGETGSHYTKGRALITRADTMQEYKLSDRRNEDEYVPIVSDPTSNMCAVMSENARDEGEIIEVEWHNGDCGFLEPGHPLRYQYMGDGDVMMVRRGTLLGYRTDYLPITSAPNPVLKRTCVLTIFLKKQGKYKSGT